MGFTFGIYFLFIIAPVLSGRWRSVINRGYEMPPTDETCGPITWERFGDRPTVLPKEERTELAKLEVMT